MIMSAFINQKAIKTFVCTYSGQGFRLPPLIFQLKLKKILWDKQGQLTQKIRINEIIFFSV